MMVFKKAIPRRTFLRGAAGALALPFLDAMVPAFAGPADTAAKPAVRMGVVFAPNGMWPMDQWTPKAEGSNFVMSPTLEPLTPFRDQILVLSGLRQVPGAKGDEGVPPHTLALTTYLTGLRPKRTAGADFNLGTTMDQIAAQELGKHTQLGSLEVSLVRHPYAGACDHDYSCTYTGTLSWRNPTTPLPMESNPRAVFERMFGDSDSTNPAVRRVLLKERRSMLDSVAEDYARFVAGLGARDRSKMAEYLDSVRDVELRIQTAEERGALDLPTLERPTGAPDTMEEYNKIMCDLIVLAYQGDLTRVSTLMFAREGPYGSQPYQELGIADTHHELSHHDNRPENLEKLSRINRFHTKLFAYFLNKLRSTPDGDGNLLDHSVLLFGSDMSDGNRHLRANLPVVLAGGAGGGMKGGRHIRYPDDTEVTNLHLTMLNLVGVHAEHFGSSTGKLDLLSVA